MSETVKWGILSTATIGLDHVIPAIKLSNNGVLWAIASRNKEKANEVAEKFGIEKAYDSYEALFLDSEVDVIYIPLPNNLHLEYTVKGLKMGKHVLCEKPIGLNKDEAAQLTSLCKEYPNLKVMEGFMYKFHPQWINAKEMIKNGEIGNVKCIHTLFSYYNADGNNIRNKIDAGGGALMDIGCYCISFPRFILETEPISVFGVIEKDSIFKTDFLTSGILNFENQVTAGFTCITQAFPYQSCHIIGDKGHIEIEYPCNAPTDGDCKTICKTATGERVMIYNANQYQLQCEAFANAIINNKMVPYPISDAENNMIIIDAIIKSAISKSLVEL